MNLPLANYQDERVQFQELLELTSARRILMFHGESGSGKTRLVEWCIEQVPAHIRYLSVQLRGNDTTAAHILYRLGRNIGWERLNIFTQHITDLMQQPSANDHSQFLKMRGYLDSLLQLAEPELRKQHWNSVTDAWFDDVKSMHLPMLLILDTYEKATSELDLWFCQYFLPRIAEISSIRVLVAGQVVPEQSSEWSHCCDYTALNGVSDAKAWLPVAYAMGREIASIDYLDGACAVLNGNPSKILDFIRGHPKIHKPLSPSQTLANRRARWRQNMNESFSLLDLRGLCFDFNVDFESIGEGNNLQDKVLSLIVFMENRGRLPELIDRCRELRSGLNW